MSLVLVAGGAGFLGSAVVRRLLGTGEGVVLVDTFDDAGDGRAVKEERVAAFSRHPRAAVVRGDAADPEFLAGALAEHRPSSVVNAMLLPPDGPGLGPLLESVRGAGIGVFVQLSEGRLYGPRDETGQRAKEDEALEPGENVDLVAKAAEEEALLASGIPFVNLRVFSAVGPSVSPARFPLDALEALFGGDEVVLPDDAPRDFVHTEDIVRGILFSIARRPLGETVNLGSGLGVRPSELVRALALRAAREVRISVSGESTRPPRVADLEKAWQLLGYSPQLGVSEIAWEIVRARQYPEEAGRALRLAEESRREPAHAPRPVSRRELFGLFRRPFDAATKKRGG
ncbi:MAG TPA: NAD-dependent epimerase/dehydratase family protein [Thermoanaerobaculia bacterium]|nr:NAD-dependent epimerase/dehydratase family protein [Thermoanaerobaculia bacterium]